MKASLFVAVVSAGLLLAVTCLTLLFSLTVTIHLLAQQFVQVNMAGRKRAASTSGDASATKKAQKEKQ